MNTLQITVDRSTRCTVPKVAVVSAITGNAVMQMKYITESKSAFVQFLISN